MRPDRDIEAIRAELERNGFVAVEFGVEGDDPANEPIDGVDILVFRDGLMVSGRSISIVYEAREPSRGAEIEYRENGSVLSERRPLASPPHHWFWEQVH